MDGVPVENGVNSCAMPGTLLASPMISCAAADKARGPRFFWSSSIILKPPAVPSPGTGGGGMAMMKASSMPDSFRRMSARITGMVSPLATRSSNGARPAKIAPALEALVKVAPSKPAKATSCSTPGTVLRISLAWRITLSVRSSEAPGGSCTTVMRYPRS